MTRRYSRARFLSFALLICLGLGSVFARLIWIQLVEHEQWKERVKKQSEYVRELPPRRGAILDALGYPLAITERRYEVGASDPAYWRDSQRSQALALALGMDSKALRRSLRGQKGHTWIHRSAVLAPGVADSLRRLPGLSIDESIRRNYPMDGIAARLLGRVDRGGHGDAGIERAWDSVLRGVPGRVLERFDGKSGGAPIMRQEIEAPVPGRDVVLTLDHRVQMILEEELEITRQEANAVSATGIVMDPRDASVLAVASVPGIPTRHGRPYASAEWRDPVVLDAFEPGSSFKLFTAASLLSRAVTDTAEVFDGGCRDPKAWRHREDMGGFYFQDVHPVGKVSLRHAYVVSSNIIFGKAVCLLQREEFESDLRRYGFGMPTACGLPGESPGILAPARKWSGRSQPTLAIGQEISVTLLQLAAGYSALLTDGTLRSPRLVESWRDEDGRDHVVATRVLRERVVPPHVPSILRALCLDVVQAEYGSGRAARVEGLSVGGKTGTAQVVLPGMVAYSDSVYIANFIGVAPADEPQLLVAIVVNQPEVARRWGGDTAAACFSRVVSKILSATRLLEHRQRIVQGSEAREATSVSEVPRLVGLSADKALEQLQRAGCALANSAPDANARVVGQMPTPGSRITQGGLVRVAWSRGGAE